MAAVNDPDWALLVDAAMRAQANAYAPYSGFAVGASLWIEGGRLVAGCNVENVSFPCGQCAEAGAVSSLVAAYGRRVIRAVVVIGSSDQFTWPCGRCRQILAEFASADAQVMSVAGNRWSDPVRLDQLLPHAFTTFD